MVNQQIQAEAVFDILSSVYERSPWRLDQIMSDMTQETTDYFFVESDGQIVAFMSLLHLLGETELTNIAVHKEYQNKGYAHQLLHKLDGLGQPVFLEVRESNYKAQGLYQSHGFKVIGKRKAYYHHPTEDAIMMRKDD
ncbi:ribosomal protein S18-alanine N-acetyltransferase [Streptococcus fryi]